MACVDFVQTCFTAGDTVNIDFQYFEDDGETSIDLTGASAQMQLLSSIGAVAQFDDFNGGITDAANGKGTFSLTATESQTLLPLPIVGDEPTSSTFVSKLRFTFADTTVKTVAGMNVSIEQNGIR
jgi:hypothetical protein